jgi:phosphohistidine swiveling domain-containing protein
MKTQALITKLKKVEWDRYAVRPYPFFLWSFVQEVYPSYKLFTGHVFDYLMVYSGKFEKIYYRQASTRKKIEALFKKNLQNIKFLKKHEKMQKKYLDQALAYNKKFIKSKDLSKLSEKQILQEFNRFIKENYYWAGGLSSGILLLPLLSDLIQQEFLLPKLVKRGEEKQINEIMGLFSQANKESHFITEDKELMRIAIKKKVKNFDKLLDKHVEKWAVLGFGGAHKLLTREDFFKRIKEEKKPKQRIKKLTATRTDEEKKIQKILKDFKVTGKEKQILNIMRSMLYNRTIEELILSQEEFIFLQFFKEIAKRNHVPLNHMKFITLPEFRQILSGKKFDFTALAKRQDTGLVLAIKNKQHVFGGQQAEKIFRKVVKEEAPKKFTGRLEGQCGSPGKVKAKARVIHHIAHLDQLKKGEILVTAATNPAYVIAMKKAGAIVTDEGGITCHAAIVSRELKKPCVIGTKYATLYLKTGDRVEVNATDGIVKKVK